MAIGLIEEAGAVLIFKIVENIGEGGFFENVHADGEGFGFDDLVAADKQAIGTGGRERGEIDG